MKGTQVHLCCRIEAELRDTEEIVPIWPQRNAQAKNGKGRCAENSLNDLSLPSHH